MPSSVNAFVSTSEASGSSTATRRSATSTTVTSTPYRAKTCANSQPIGPPPSTTSDAGRSVTVTASRLVQYGVPSRPSIGGAAGRVPVLSTTPLRATYVVPSTRTRPGPVQHAAAAMETGSAVLEALDRDRVVPVVGGLVAHPAGDLGPVGLHRRGPTEVGDLARGGDHVGRRDHHLRGHAAVVRALAADEAVLDADDVQTGAGQLDGDVLTPGTEAQDDDVDLDVGRRRDVGHCLLRCLARAKQKSP